LAAADHCGTISLNRPDLNSQDIDRETTGQAIPMKKRDATGKQTPRKRDRTDRREVEERLRRSEGREEELSIQSRNLEELNIALKAPRRDSKGGLRAEGRSDCHRLPRQDGFEAILHRKRRGKGDERGVMTFLHSHQCCICRSFLYIFFAFIQ
jgi:hypothetical protein